VNGGGVIEVSCRAGKAQIFVKASGSVTSAMVVTP